MIILLLLLIGAWMALDQGRDIQGGLLLGVAVTLKLIAWPLVVVFLLLRRKWRAAGVAVCMIGVTTCAAGLILGFDMVKHYYLEAGPVSAHLARSTAVNLSLWTISWRLFEGTSSPWNFVEALRLYYSPDLARYLSFVFPSVLFLIGLSLDLRARRLDASFGILICTSILISPVAWSYYLILTLIPIVISYKFLTSRGWPEKETNAALILGLLLLISPFIDMQARFDLGAKLEVSFLISLLTLLHVAALLGLIRDHGIFVEFHKKEVGPFHRKGMSIGSYKTNSDSSSCGIP